MFDEPAPDLGMDQFSTFRIPERRLRHIDFDDVGIALQLELDGLPISLKVAIAVVGGQLDAIASAARGWGSVIPGCYDHCKYLDDESCFVYLRAY